MKRRRISKAWGFLLGLILIVQCAPPRNFGDIFIGMPLEDFREIHPDTIQSVSMFAAMFPGFGVHTLSRIPADVAVLFEEYQFVDDKLVSVTMIFTEAADFDGILGDVTLLNGEADEYSLRGEDRIIEWMSEKCVIVLSENTENMPLPDSFREDARFVLIIQDASGAHRLPKAMGW